MIRTGYTTGSSAAAACKIATETLFSGRRVKNTIIDTPKGIKLKIVANYISCTDKEVNSYVIKNYSDDPDVTKGIEIHVKATRSTDPGIYIKTGVGIGIVTKKGLRVPVGKPAINPVPMEMIINEVQKVLPEDKGVQLLITVPNGVEIAKKTFNSKLGIIGGISILGTTGIVEPMSENAFKKSLKLEMNVKVQNNEIKTLILVFGNFGLKYIEDLNLSNESTIKTSNFIYYMITAASKLGIKKILLAGHAGKMVKVAFGMKNTHSKYGDNRMKSITQSCNKNHKFRLNTILKSNTTDEAIEHLKNKGIHSVVFNDIANRCKQVCEGWVNNQLKVECIIFTTIYGHIASTNGVDNLLRELKK